MAAKRVLVGVHKVAQHGLTIGGGVRRLLVGKYISTSCRRAKQEGKNRKTKLVNVALVGEPNSGKSTLTNSLVGQKICAVTDVPHTTRQRTRGVFTQEDTQVVLLDTPGIVTLTEGRRLRMTREHVRAPESALDDADVIAVISDAGAKRTRGRIHEQILSSLERHRETPSILVLNKTDKVKQKVDLLELTAVLNEERRKDEWGYEDTGGWGSFRHVFMVSAKNGDGVQDLRNYFVELAKPADWLFPLGTSTELSDDERIREVFREKLLQLYEHEIPWQTRQASGHEIREGVMPLEGAGEGEEGEGGGGGWYSVSHWVRVCRLHCESLIRLSEGVISKLWYPDQKYSCCFGTLFNWASNIGPYSRDGLLTADNQSELFGSKTWWTDQCRFLETYPLTPPLEVTLPSPNPNPRANPGEGGHIPRNLDWSKIEVYPPGGGVMLYSGMGWEGIMGVILSNPLLTSTASKHFPATAEPFRNMKGNGCLHLQWNLFTDPFLDRTVDKFHCFLNLRWPSFVRGKMMGNLESTKSYTAGRKAKPDAWQRNWASWRHWLLQTWSTSWEKVWTWLWISEWRARSPMMFHYPCIEIMYTVYTCVLWNSSSKEAWSE